MQARRKVIFIRNLMWVLVLTGLLSVLSLYMAGCGDSENDSDTDGDSESNPDGDQEDEETPSDGDQSDTDGDGEETPLVNVLPFEPAGPDAAPDPMQPGPFPVGVKTYDFVDTSRQHNDTGEPRKLKVEVWYPAVQAAKDGPFYTYDLKAEALSQDMGDKAEKIQQSDIKGLETTSIRDAEIDREHARYPVVLFSHGAFGIRWQSTFYTIQLASHGYIVISVDHEENTVWDIIRDGYNALLVANSANKRPDDMIFVLDRFLEFDAEDDHFFSSTMDADNIGISGHSLGGLTSIATPCRDSRIKVSVPHSPAIYMGALIGGCHIDEYPVPVFVMGGTLDRTVPWKDQYCEYRMIDGTPKHIYEVVGGGHYTFSDMCKLDLVALAEDFDFGDAEDALHDGCSDTDNVPYEKAWLSINHYAIAYLNYHLRASENSWDYFVEKSEDPFDVVNFTEGQIPDWPEDGGCNPED